MFFLLRLKTNCLSCCLVLFSICSTNGNASMLDESGASTRFLWISVFDPSLQEMCFFKSWIQFWMKQDKKDGIDQTENNGRLPGQSNTLKKIFFIELNLIGCQTKSPISWANKKWTYLKKSIKRILSWLPGTIFNLLSKLECIPLPADPDCLNFFLVLPQF